jgi:hypothetical protein
VRLHVDQHFKGVTVERFAEIYHSEAFNNAVAPVTGMRTRALVEERIDERGVRHRRVRMEPDTKLPAMIQKVADSIARGGITYDEVSTYDATQHLVHYRVDSKANDRVKVEGTIRFIADGDGVRRVIDGVIEVKAPLGVGGVIERFIEAETVKGYDRIHALLQRWIDEHPPAPTSGA